MNKYIACYLRLSKDDDNAGESNSIVNQRQLIKEYIYSSDEFFEMQTLEFIDDGYSGTNFNRPGIKKLLEKAQKGEIECVIVKDFSRFGRHYLEVSKYIEQIFPYINVRFIAINDNYDSDKHKGTTAEIDVPIRNMINALYSVDISKKAKSAKQTKLKQGISVNAYALYGYKKDTANKGKMLIDEPAAAVVRQVFQLAFDGFKIVQIAKKLNEENILTPSAYKIKNGFEKDWNNIKNAENSKTGKTDKSIWTSSSVFNILKDERYIGTFIGGRREAGKLGSKKYIYKPREEWICVPNSHPAIIKQEQFNKVAGMIRYLSKTSQNRTKKTSNRPLYKKVWCAKCGHMLQYKDSKNPYYSCDTAIYSYIYGCMRGNIREKELNDAVIATLLTQLKLFADSNNICRMISNKINETNTLNNSNSTNSLEGNSILQIDNEIKNLKSNRRKLYERYKNSEINQILYLCERETLENKLDDKITAHEMLIAQKQNHENVLESIRRFSEIFVKYQSTTELTKEIADEFIQSVHVHNSDRITVKFKFQDEFERVVKIIQTVNKS